MRHPLRAALLLALVTALSGCSDDWQRMGVAIDNDGPAAHVTVRFERAGGQDYDFAYDVPANGTWVGTWSLPQDTFQVTVQAGDRTATGREELCASHGFTIHLNATAIWYRLEQGDGFTGC